MVKKFFASIKPQHLFILGCILLIFFAALKTPYDPDMGWHLQNGHYLLEHNLQVPSTDIYTYTMPDYPLIMHEWVTDIIMYSIYTTFGFWGLSLVFAGITAAAFFIVAKSVRARPEYQIIASLIGALASYTIVGIRPQVITLLFLGILLYILYRFIENSRSKIIFLLPLLFLIWVNLHGGFAIGLFVLGLFLLAEFLKIFFQKIYQGIKSRDYYIKIILTKDWFKMLYLTVFSGIATLINPYGWRIYVELYATITDPLLKYDISEWYPVSLASSQSYFFVGYLALTVILGLLMYRKLKFTSVFMFLVFAYIGFSSWRNMPLFIIFSIPLWVYFARGLVGGTLSKLIGSKLVLGLLILAVAITGYQQIAIVQKSNGSVETMSKYSQYKYPYEAVQYIKTNPPKGTMFNMYNWGGYLIWQCPEYKVFIDGRMPSWKHEGKNAMKDFKNLVTLQPSWKDVLEKYKISWALLDKKASLNLVLLSEGWENVYEDNLAVIFIKND